MGAVNKQKDTTMAARATNASMIHAMQQFG
jgi:hypothetical protein